jgi:hypothetical protein
MIMMSLIFVNVYIFHKCRFLQALEDLSLHASKIFGSSTKLFAYQTRTLHWMMHLERRIACGWGIEVVSNQDMRFFDAEWDSQALDEYPDFLGMTKKRKGFSSNDKHAKKKGIAYDELTKCLLLLFLFTVALLEAAIISDFDDTVGLDEIETDDENGGSPMQEALELDAAATRPYEVWPEPQSCLNPLPAEPSKPINPDAACPACTYHNPINRIQCDMCDTLLVTSEKVECPICARPFAQQEIQSHAATCEGNPVTAEVKSWGAHSFGAKIAPAAGLKNKKTSKTLTSKIQASENRSSSLHDVPSSLATQVHYSVKKFGIKRSKLPRPAVPPSAVDRLNEQAVESVGIPGSAAPVSGRSVRPVFVDWGKCNTNITFDFPRDCYSDEHFTRRKRRSRFPPPPKDACLLTAARGSNWKPQRFLQFRGGILADEMGLGKTLTIIALALCQADPFPVVVDSKFSMNQVLVEVEREKDCKGPSFQDLSSRIGALHRAGHIRTSANLIVCPSHLANHWHDEIKKHSHKSVNVIKITTKRDHDKVTVKDLLTSNFVIVTVQFLKGTYYNKLRKQAGTLLPNHVGLADLPTLEWFYWSIHACVNFVGIAH